MAIGSCRRDGCVNPRRVRRGIVEPLCDECYRAAMDKVARELAQGARGDRRARCAQITEITPTMRSGSFPEQLPAGRLAS
jgi:hypothetical protein